MKYYFSHPISTYNTVKESCLIELIKKCPFFSNPWVINPNSLYHEDKYKKLREDREDYFLSLIDECDVLIYYPFEDGFVGPETAKEIERALKNKKRVFCIEPEDFSIIEKFKLEKTY